MNSIPPSNPTSAATPPSTPQPRLVRAAHEFEAQMMKELMEPLNHGPSLTGADSDSDDDSGSGNALGQFASEAPGRALSERGGFGVADSIIKQLSHSGNLKQQVPSTGNLHLNTVMRRDE